MPVNFGAALVALGEADAAVAGAVLTTARRDPGGALGHRHRARRQPGELRVLHGAAGRRGAHLHRLRRGARSPTPGRAGRHRARRRARPRPAGGRRARGSPSSPTAPGAAPTGPGWRRCARRPRASASSRPTSRSDGELQGDAALVPEVAERKAPGSPLAAGPTCWCFPTSTPATSPTSWCSGWPARPRSGRSSRASPGRWPTCRAGPRPMILSRWRPWWRCRATPTT